MGFRATARAVALLGENLIVNSVDCNKLLGLLLFFNFNNVKFVLNISIKIV